MNEIRDIHQVIEVLFSQLATVRKEVELLTKKTRNSANAYPVMSIRRTAVTAVFPRAKTPCGKSGSTFEKRADAPVADKRDIRKKRFGHGFSKIRN
jgi:hypothetical protein